MKKTILILLAGLPFVGMARIEAPEFDENDDENEVEVLNEDVSEIGFDFPEALTDTNLDSLMNLYMMKTYLTTSDDCQMLSENPEFSHDVYRDRLKRMPTIMDMAYNDVVRSCIDRYMVRLRRQVSYMLGAANFYMPIFEQALDTYQLPLELKYLPIIESALNPTAVSRVGATGLWQFMLATGKAYGLEVTSLTDDRRDPALPPITAGPRTSTEPYAVLAESATTGKSIPICRRRRVATCRPSLPPTTP